MKDDPELDGTEYAHPAYWRGYDDAVVSFCKRVNTILSGEYNEAGVSHEPWESTKRILISVEKLMKTLEKKGYKMYICVCKRWKEHELKQLISDKNLDTLDDIKECEICTQCELCEPEIIRLLDENNDKKTK